MQTQQVSVDNKNNTNLQGEQRFELKRHLANTLQGRIYVAIDKTNGSKVIVKETWKQLVNLNRSREGHRVFEDFHKEKEILNHLSKQPDCNSGFVKILDEWQDDNCFFYAMECCEGGELFEFVKNAHVKDTLAKNSSEQQNLPQKPLKEPNEWIKIVRHIFRQLVDCVSWMHKKKTCHLDLSLENTMLCDTTQFQVKIIDFGLAKHFTDDKFTYNCRVGKTGYMAPEVFAKESYDARKADIWSLGVMLFMMLLGAPPYDAPNPRNPAFYYIINGDLAKILQHWKRLQYVTEDALDLMIKIFKPETERISIEDIRKHPFVQLDSDSLSQSVKNQQELQMDTKERLDDEVEMEDHTINNHTINDKNRPNDTITITLPPPGTSPSVSNRDMDTNAIKKHQKEKPNIDQPSNSVTPTSTKADDFKNDDKSTTSFNGDTQAKSHLDIRHRKFESNEANHFQKKILEMESQTNVDSWNNFIDQLQKIINDKHDKKKQILQQHNPGFDAEGVVSQTTDSEAQIEREIEELQSLHKYVIAK